MKILMGIVAAGLVASVVGAAPLEKTDIAAGAAWAAHLDLEALRAGEVGRYLLGRLSQGKEANQIAALNAILNLDLRTDINGLTLYGLSEREEDGVVILRGRVDVARLATFLKVNETYRELQHAGLVVHHWTENKTKKDKDGKEETKLESNYLASPAAGVLVFGRSEANLGAALDVLAARKPAARGGFVDVGDPAIAQPVLWAAADLTRTDQKKAAKSKILKLATTGRLSVAEQGGNVVGSMSIICVDANMADSARNIIQGLTALALAGTDDPKAAELIQSVKVETEGARVGVSLRMPVQNFIEAMKKQELEKNAAKPAGK